MMRLLGDAVASRGHGPARRTPSNYTTRPGRELARLEKRMAIRPAMPPLLWHRLQERHADITEFLADNARTEALS
jgi:hypothetical protein